MIREGYIEKIKYQSEDSAYCVLIVDGPEGEEIFVGDIAGAAEGVYIQAEGEYTHHPVYDLQFKVTSYEISMPEDIGGIVAFLGSGAIKGIGNALAKRIVKKFGTDTLRIIDEEPERLAEVKGISQMAAEKIAIYYHENRSSRNVVMFLSKFGISTNLAMKIYKEFHDDVYKIVRENPYELADKVTGVGFKIADQIAMNAGISPESDFRAQSAILFELKQAEYSGHMYLPEMELAKEVYRLVGNPDIQQEEFLSRLDDLITGLHVKGKVHVETVDGVKCIYSGWNFKLEQDSATMLLGLRDDFPADPGAFTEAVDTIEDEEGIALEDEQKDAVDAAVRNGVAVITGGPGTGKTTIIRAIMEYFELEEKETLLAAPTGRAAKRMKESTGYDAQTIHRMLEFSGMPSEDGSQKNTFKFMRNKENPLECDAIIVDEASMIDANLFYVLLSAIPIGTRLILVGDTDQLPSVGAGSVLDDIIKSGVCPVVRLNRVFRQGEKSSIIGNAHKIRRGEQLKLTNDSEDFFYFQKQDEKSCVEEIKSLVKERITKFSGIESKDIQVLTPLRKYGLGVEELNVQLQEVLNPPMPCKREKKRGEIIFREGDKVMQTRNNYKQEWKMLDDHENLVDQGIGVFNGDMGLITKINDFDEIVSVQFDDGRIADYTYTDLDQLEHSFAITIHKSQGSEYPAVVIPLLRVNPGFFSRNLLYTAVTRAKSMVAIVGNPGVVNYMITNVSEQKRYTGFASRLKEMAEALSEGESPVAKPEPAEQIAIDFGPEDYDEEVALDSGSKEDGIKEDDFDDELESDYEDDFGDDESE